MTHSSSTFERLPDELTIRILVHLTPEDILLNISPCSRQLHAISHDNALWSVLCERSLNICSSRGTRFVADRWIKDFSADQPGTIVRFWNRFLRIWTPWLGWWAKVHGMEGAVYRISADMADGVIQQHRLVLNNRLDAVNRGGLELCVFDPDHYLHNQSAEARYSAEEDGTSSEVTYQDVFCPSKVTNRRMVYDNDISQMLVSIYPSSALVPAFDVRNANEDMTAWDVPSMHMGAGQQHFVSRLRSPEFHDVLNADKAPSPIYPGWYTADYSTKGCQLFYIHVVDPNVDPIIPGPMHDTLPDNELVRTSRRIEAIKITGDDHILKGSRTFVGFLDAAATRIGPAGIPAKSTRPLGAPWPTDETSFNDGEPKILQDPYTATSGMTMPGYGKASISGETTIWLYTTVHVASPEEIQMTYNQYVFTYRRFHVEDLSEHTS